MKVVAAFAYRYEPDWLVDQLRDNLAWVDGFAELNTRDRTDMWMPRIDRVRALQKKARRMGADWVLHLDPDERLETTAERVIRGAVEDSNVNRYVLRLRELWTPDQYRVDGIWGQKWRRRLYRLASPVGEPQHLDVNLYHLKMIEPANRTERVRVHTAANYWDNRVRGFDYLADEEGIELEPIPHGRGFDPPYRRYDFHV